VNRELFSFPIRNGEIPVTLLTDGSKYPYRIDQDQWFIWRGTRKIPQVLVPLPMGYRTDGPSIPWYAQGIVKKDGPVWPAALFHDVACSAELFGVMGANSLMDDAMTAFGVPAPDHRKVMAAVNLLCWTTWASHRKAEVLADRQAVKEASQRLWRYQGPLFHGCARIEDVLGL
jgi:hypothetical protein